jgi:predicted PurR-regulated permease PerM
MTQFPDPGADLGAIRKLLTGLLILACLATIYVARALLLPVVLAVLLALVLRPATRWLARHGLPDAVGGPLLILVVAGGTAAGAYAASGPVSTLVQRAPVISAELRWKLRDILAQVEEAREASAELEDMTDGDDQAERVVLEEAGVMGWALSSLAGAGSAFAVALVLATFLLASGGVMSRRLVAATKPQDRGPDALALIQDVEERISRYLGAITVINAGLGVAIGGAMWILGLPDPAVWGLAAFLLNFLPFIGAVIGAAGVGVVALVTFDTAGYALLCPAVYLVLTSIEGNLVTPILVGRRLAINTVAVFVTVITSVWLWGAIGAFLAVPVLLVIKAVAEQAPRLRALDLMLGSEVPGS